MTVYELIRDFWAGVAAAGGGLVWLMRLESKSLDNEKELRRIYEQEIPRLRRQREEDLELARQARAETHDLLTEVRSDVKQLLQRNT